MSRDAQLVQAWGGPCTCQGESPSSCAMFWLWLLETQAVECVWLLQTTDSIKTRNVFHTMHHSESVPLLWLQGKVGLESSLKCITQKMALHLPKHCTESWMSSWQQQNKAWACLWHLPLFIPPSHPKKPSARLKPSLLCMESRAEQLWAVRYHLASRLKDKSCPIWFKGMDVAVRTNSPMSLTEPL